MSAAITFDAVAKSYAGVPVLRGVSFRVRPAATTALVGINGAGKTTCIKSLLDFCAIESGAIRIGGTGHRDPAARAALFYLPERFVPPVFFAGQDYLRHAARLHGFTVEAGRLSAMVDALELDPAALRRPVRDYSKGMVQKLGLIAAFASDRTLLVLDEPMSGLDPKARILVKRQLAAERERGRTVFLTTHMLADVPALCDELIVLHEGRVAFAGTPADCLARFGGADLEDAFLRCIDGVAAP